MARNRQNHNLRERSDEILFIDARKIGTMTSRKNKAFSDDDIAKISGVYHNWRRIGGNYEDIQGFCKAATLADVEANNFVLTPGRYVGTEEVEDDGIPYDEKVTAISENLKGYFEKSIELQQRIKTNLVKVGIEI